MSKRKDGGPAFPCEHVDLELRQRLIEQHQRTIPLHEIGRLSSLHPGMTLRDYFAAAALQGEMASETPEFAWTKLPALAKRCYEIADAMLAARDKEDS